MARRTVLASSKLIAGATLLGIGMFVLYGNLAGDIAQVKQVLGVNGSEALGILPAVILAASQAGPASPLGHQGLLTGILRMSISFWPSFLVIVGTLLLRDAFGDKVKALPIPSQYLQKNISKIKTLNVDFAVPCSTHR